MPPDRFSLLEQHSTTLAADSRSSNTATMSFSKPLSSRSRTTTNAVRATANAAHMCPRRTPHELKLGQPDGVVMSAPSGLVTGTSSPAFPDLMTCHERSAGPFAKGVPGQGPYALGVVYFPPPRNGKGTLVYNPFVFEVHADFRYLVMLRCIEAFFEGNHVLAKVDTVRMHLSARAAGLLKSALMLGAGPRVVATSATEDVVTGLLATLANNLSRVDDTCDRLLLPEDPPYSEPSEFVAWNEQTKKMFNSSMPAGVLSQLRGVHVAECTAAARDLLVRYLGGGVADSADVFRSMVRKAVEFAEQLATPPPPPEDPLICVGGIGEDNEVALVQAYVRNNFVICDDLWIRMPVDEVLQDIENSKLFTVCAYDPEAFRLRVMGYLQDMKLNRQRIDDEFYYVGMRRQSVPPSAKERLEELVYRRKQVSWEIERERSEPNLLPPAGPAGPTGPTMEPAPFDEAGCFSTIKTE